MQQIVELPADSVPDLSQFQIEDGQPVDSIHSEKQHRLLATPLSRPWPGLAPGRRWMVFSNVGYFYRTSPRAGLAPDVMLSLDVEPGDPLHVQADRSYFLWERGKPPEVVVEFVSNRPGAELGDKRVEYARGLVPYYAVFDPRCRLSNEVLQAFRRNEDTGLYVRLPRPWFPLVWLGLTVWNGVYEGLDSVWLRWCDEQGNLIPTPDELIDAEQHRADEQRKHAEEQRQRADRLAARLRELGINPDEV